MNKEEKYISQPLAKELQKVAKEKGFELPKSEYSWIVDNETGKATLSKSWNPFDLNECEEYSYYKTYDTSELGEMLPDTVRFARDGKVFVALGIGKKYETIGQRAKTEAEVRGKMLIYLIKNKLIK